jgi:signal transduction histidine kinase
MMATRRTELLVDAGIAGGLAAVSVSIVVGLVDGPAAVLGSFLAIAHTAPLVVRRRYPLAVLGAMIATAFIYTLAGFPSVGLGPAALVAVFTVASACDRRRSLLATGAATASMALIVSVSGAHIETIVANGIAFAVAWFIGDRMRASRTRAEEAEQTRDEATREAVRDERLRIARELHDVVAHALSVIAVQSGTGRLVLDSSPETARDALCAIETTSRTALAEMRRLLTVLRDDDWTEPLGPAPGLGQLDDLVAQTVAAGLPVRVDVQGERVALPLGVDVAAYRIVQEALTNARKHAHASHVDLGVCYRRDQVSLEVVDDGRGEASEHAAGHGLVGMRERVALYGGHLEIGPGPNGGFRVAATLPNTGEVP